MAYNLDAAAVVFLTPAGRGGQSGYLVSDSVKNWISGSETKMLLGYPVAGKDGLLRGRMYATLESIYGFEPVFNWVYATTGFRSYPGNSGGPVCVLHPTGRYYPAAIYLGGTGRPMVRVIDAEVATLINRAELMAYTGGNDVGPGPPPIPSPGLGLGMRYGQLQVDLGPTEALAAGAGWRLLDSGQTNYVAEAAYSYTLFPATYTLEMREIDGFQTPTNRTVTVLSDHTAALSVTYAPAVLEPPVFRNDPKVGDGNFALTLVGAAGQTVVVEQKEALGDPEWTPVWTNTFGGDGTVVFEHAVAADGNRFFRARVGP